MSKRLRFIVEVSTGHPVGKDVTQTVLLTVVDPFVDEMVGFTPALSEVLTRGLGLLSSTLFWYQAISAEPYELRSIEFVFRISVEFRMT